MIVEKGEKVLAFFAFGFVLFFLRLFFPPPFFKRRFFLVDQWLDDFRDNVILWIIQFVLDSRNIQEIIIIVLLFEFFFSILNEIGDRRPACSYLHLSFFAFK